MAQTYLSNAFIGIGSLLLIFVIERFMSKLPSALTAVALSSILVAILSPDIELMSMIPRGLPSLRMPVGISASTRLEQF